MFKKGGHFKFRKFKNSKIQLVFTLNFLALKNGLRSIFFVLFHFISRWDLVFWSSSEANISIIRFQLWASENVVYCRFTFIVVIIYATLIRLKQHSAIISSPFVVSFKISTYLTHKYVTKNIANLTIAEIFFEIHIQFQYWREQGIFYNQDVCS